MIYLVLKIKSTTVFLTGVPELLCWSCGVFSERVGSCLCLWGLFWNYHPHFWPIETGFVVSTQSNDPISIESPNFKFSRWRYILLHPSPDITNLYVSSPPAKWVLAKLSSMSASSLPVVHCEGGVPFANIQSSSRFLLSLAFACVFSHKISSGGGRCCKNLPFAAHHHSLKL